MTQPTEEQQKNFEMHQTLALIHGFNEMATKATTLGEKVYYRLARDAAEKHFNELGGKIDRGVEHQPLLVIPGHVPEIRFDERDIELMRECVARYDRETSTGLCDGGCGTDSSMADISTVRHGLNLCENCAWEHDHGEEDCGWECSEIPAALLKKHRKGKCGTFCPNPKKVFGPTPTGSEER